MPRDLHVMILIFVTVFDLFFFIRSPIHYDHRHHSFQKSIRNFLIVKNWILLLFTILRYSVSFNAKETFTKALR